MYVKYRSYGNHGRNCIFVTLWKESLSIDGHQFHQYQQNEQSLCILAELAEYKKDHDIGNTDPGLEQAQKCGGVKPVSGITTVSS